MSIIHKNSICKFLKTPSLEKSETANFIGSWYDAWDGTGWERIWKRFLELVNEEYEKMSAEEKSKLTILETKEKFGELRVCMSGYNDEIRRLIDEIEHISTYTCIDCGKQPVNEKGEHTICTFRKGWIVNLCEDCMLKRDKYGDSKTICDNNKISVTYFSEKEDIELVWNPWKNYKF